jgi:hypothetical protein
MRAPAFPATARAPRPNLFAERLTGRVIPARSALDFARIIEMDHSPRTEGQKRPDQGAPQLHVIWHWVIFTAVMTALIGGAALVF